MKQSIRFVIGVIFVFFCLSVSAENWTNYPFGTPSLTDTFVFGSPSTKTNLQITAPNLVEYVKSRSFPMTNNASRVSELFSSPWERPLDAPLINMSDLQPMASVILANYDGLPIRAHSDGGWGAISQRKLELGFWLPKWIGTGRICRLINSRPF